jgi:hypothetical protein
MADVAKRPGAARQAAEFHYLSAPNHPAHSIASEFFTDDELFWDRSRRIQWFALREGHGAYLISLPERSDPSVRKRRPRAIAKPRGAPDFADNPSRLRSQINTELPSVLSTVFN